MQLGLLRVKQQQTVGPEREQRTECVNLQLGSQSNDRDDTFVDQEIVVTLLLLSVNASSCSIRC